MESQKIGTLIGVLPPALEYRKKVVECPASASVEVKVDYWDGGDQHSDQTNRNAFVNHLKKVRTALQKDATCQSGIGVM